MVNKIKTIFANMSWLVISQIIASICAFIWTILIAKYLGPSEFGIMGTAVSIASTFVFLADFGISTYIIRAISTDMNQEAKYLNNTLTLKLFLAILYFIITFIALLILGWNNYIILICMLFSLESVIKTFQDVLFASFKAHEVMKYQAYVTIFINVSLLLSLIFISFTDFGLIGVALAYIIVNLVALAYDLYLIRKNIIKPHLSINTSFFKHLIKAGFPFATISFLYTIYYSIDIIMLTNFSTTYDTGLYNSAYKLISVLTVFYTVYTSVIFPVMSKLFKNEEKLLNISFVKSIKYLLLATVPIATFIFFYGYDIINIYGPEFVEASGVLKILIWTVCFLFVNGACTLVLNASNEEYSVTKIYLFAALFNVGLNLILIPKYSIYGASVSTILSEVLILVLELYMIRKIGQLPNRGLILDIVKIVFASLTMGVILQVLQLNMWVAMVVSIIVYFTIIILIKTFDSDDKMIIKQIIGR